MVNLTDKPGHCGNFALVVISVSKTEWIYLYHYDHRRDQFNFQEKQLSKKLLLTP